MKTFERAVGSVVRQTASKAAFGGPKDQNLIRRDNRQILMIMLFYSAAALLAAVLTWDMSKSPAGFIRILSHPSQLTIDYFCLGTAGTSFLNSALVGLSCTALYRLSGAKLNGVSLMAFFLAVGFSFFGINLYNIWPCILGTWLFARVSRERFADLCGIALFSTGLAPFVSEITWRYPVFEGFPATLAFRLLFAAAIGALIGFLMPVLCRHSPNLHRGYSLYNAAAVAGLLGILLFSCLYRAAGVEIPSNTEIGDSHTAVVLGFSAVLSVSAITAGLGMNRWRISGYGEILKSTGYGCDFTRDAGIPLTLVNIGVFGLFVTAYYTVTGAAMTGPTAGSIICLLAVASCGAHCLNVLPLMIGYALAASLCSFRINDQAIIVGFCFSAALCPISGRFGAAAGIAVGILHACMVTTVVTAHGGMCLYNGGFTCSILAILTVPLLEHFFIPRDRMALLPKRKPR
ncbi:MAG: DUF1576 domain-containing protein [Clostridia bacterium]|nr:DUF1576 domain-containing protein [Clostridia bacterium]